MGNSSPIGPMVVPPRHWYFTVSLTILMIIAQGAQADEFSLNVHAHPTTISLGQSVHLIVRGQASHAVDLTLPKLSNWQILSQTRTNSETRRGRSQTYTRTIELVLQPKKADQLTIGVVEMKARGQVKKSDSILITVAPPAKSKGLGPSQSTQGELTDRLDEPSMPELGHKATPRRGVSRPDFTMVFEKVSTEVVGLAAGIMSENVFRPHNKGSGFAWDSKGHVVTSAHLIADTTEIRVRRKDGLVLRAELVGYDTATDVALLHVPGLGLDGITRADTENLKPGQWVAAIGNPYGMTHSITAGVVSAIGRRNLPKGAPKYADFIQSDAAIFPGNSGGPLVDGVGQVIGLNTAILETGISFSARIEFVTAVVERLMTEGVFLRGFAGLYLKTVSQIAASAAGLMTTEGARVRKVVDFGPGDDAGLQPGDIILKFNGQTVEEPGSLAWSIAKTRPGTSVRLHIARGHERQTVSLVVVSPPEE